MKIRCPFCNEGHNIVEVRPTMYANITTGTTRLYLGSCRICKGTGMMEPLPFDTKKISAGEADVAGQ